MLTEYKDNLVAELLKMTCSRCEISYDSGTKRDYAETSNNYNGKKEDGKDCERLHGNNNDIGLFPVGTFRKINGTNITSISDSSIRPVNKPRGRGEDDDRRKWVVFIAAFWSVFVCTGFPFNMSVLNVEFLEHFGRSNAETSLIQAFTIGIFSTSGLPVGVMVDKYGVRKIGIFGSLLATFGIAISFIATSIPFLVVTLGVLTGVGFSACYLSALTSVNEYFGNKWKCEALSFLNFGGGCGLMTFPQLFNVLIKEFGWRGCLLIVCGATLNMVPCFAVWKPKKAAIDSNKCEVSTITAVCGTSTDKQVGIREKLTTLMRNKVNILYTIAIVMTFSAITSVISFLVSYIQVKGFDQKTSVFLYSFMTISSTFFRLFTTFFKRIPRLNVLITLALFVSIGSVSCAMIPGAVSYLEHIVLMGLFGMMFGGSTSLIAIVTASLFGREYYTIGFGVIMTIVGFANGISGPVAGYLRDITGSYAMQFYLASVSFGVASCLFVLMTVIQKHEGSNSEQPARYLERRGSRRRSSILPWKGITEYIF